MFRILFPIFSTIILLCSGCPSSNQEQPENSGSQQHSEEQLHPEGQQHSEGQQHPEGQLHPEGQQHSKEHQHRPQTPESHSSIQIMLNKREAFIKKCSNWDVRRPALNPMCTENDIKLLIQCIQCFLDITDCKSVTSFHSCSGMCSALPVSDRCKKRDSI